jgi:hypothetical protein
MFGHYPSTRRRFLQVGALGAFGLSLPALWQAEARAKAAGGGKGRVKSCIFLFLWGGPSHIDTFDMKPEAPAEIRGLFQPIATTVPGTSIVEHLPEMAKLARRYTIVRTLNHKRFVHHPAGSYILTGVDPKTDTAAAGAPRPDDPPALGALAGRLAPSQAGLPPSVMLPARVLGQQNHLKGQTGGWLGSQWDPMVITQDPNNRNFQVDGMKPLDGMPPERMAARRDLLAALDGRVGDLDAATRAMTVLQQRAFELLASGKGQAAFNLQAEPKKVRDRYGRSAFGQGCLLARRLIEAGSRLVTVTFCDVGQRYGDHIWDTHGKNFSQLKEDLLPPLDVAYSALLQDLIDRGMLEDTVVYLGGEFGRTPRVGQNLGGGVYPDGRDHYPYCFSGVLAGGLTRPGMIYGASDKHASAPTRDPVSIEDLTATLFAAMGLDPSALLQTPDKRPMPVSHGHPIQGLLR